MTPEQVAIEAEQFMAWCDKHGLVPAQGIDAWAFRKDLGAADLRAILRAATLLDSDRRIA